MASTFTMYVQLIAVIMCMCTHKVIKSHRSLLMLLRVNVFECCQSSQNNYWCLNIHSVQNYLSESCGLLLAVVLPVSIYEANASKH